MVIQKLILELKKLLQGRARRTKTVYDSIDGIIDNIDLLFGETQKIVEKLYKIEDTTFEPFYEHKIGDSLKNCFISLKSLKEIDKFTNLLYIFDKVLDQYHLILQDLVKKNEKLKDFIENIEFLEKKLDIKNQEYIDKIKKDFDMNIDTSKNTLEYEVNNQCQPLQKWILIDKYNVISDDILEDKWDYIEGTTYISKDYSSEILETVKNIESTDFIEFYQSIGKNKEDFNLKRLEKLDQNQLKGIKLEYLQSKMKIPRFKKIISDALHFDSKAERFLKEEMERNEK